MTEEMQPSTSQGQASNTDAGGASGSGFSIPAEFSDRGWAKENKFSSYDDLFKAYDNSQSLLGKRPAGIPAADAPSEEWDSFYKAFGRPEAADGYTLPDVDTSEFGEDFDIGGLKNEAMGLMFEAGLSQKQAEKLWQSYMGKELEAVKHGKQQTAEQQAELDKLYDEATQKLFGDKVGDVQAKTIEAIKKYAPEDMQGVFSDMAANNPKALVPIMAVVNGIMAEADKVAKEYGKEGSLTSGAQTQSKSMDEVRQELAQLRTSQAARDFTHPDHKKTMEQISALSGSVQKFYSR